MDERTTAAGDAEHRNALLHLPWYATGWLEPAEHARVARHVAGCAACQAELALEAALANRPAQAPPSSPDAGWARLKARLEAERAPAPVLADAPPPHPARPALADWRSWAIAAQFVLVVLLAAYLAATRPAAEGYRALGRPQPTPGGDLLVMFAPDTPERTLREILTRADARMVDGPTVTGAYVLQVPAGGRQAALSALRASPTVTLAEPLGPEPQP